MPVYFRVRTILQNIGDQPYKSQTPLQLLKISQQCSTAMAVGQLNIGT